jgi:hypothetical protein
MDEAWYEEVYKYRIVSYITTHELSSSPHHSGAVEVADWVVEFSHPRHLEISTVIFAISRC